MKYLDLHAVDSKARMPFMCVVHARDRNICTRGSISLRMMAQSMIDHRGERSHTSAGHSQLTSTQSWRASCFTQPSTASSLMLQIYRQEAKLPFIELSEVLLDYSMIVKPNLRWSSVLGSSFTSYVLICTPRISHKYTEKLWDLWRRDRKNKKYCCKEGNCRRQVTTHLLPRGIFCAFYFWKCHVSIGSDYTNSCGLTNEEKACGQLFFCATKIAWKNPWGRSYGRYLTIIREVGWRRSENVFCF